MGSYQYRNHCDRPAPARPAAWRGRAWRPARHGVVTSAVTWRGRAPCELRLVGLPGRRTPSNGKKIAAAALSGLMAMGTLPVAALAETGIETQADGDYTKKATDDTLTFSYFGKDYSAKNGKKVTVAEEDTDADSDWNAAVVVLKSLGSLTFKATGAANTFDVYDGSTNVGKAYANVSGSQLVVTYDFDGYSSTPTTTIDLDVQGQGITGMTLQRVDADGNIVNSYGTVTYNGADQTLALFDNGVPVNDSKTTNVKITGTLATGKDGVDKTGTVSTDGTYVTVHDAGKYGFEIERTNGDGTTTKGYVYVTVAKLDLSKANVQIRDYINGARGEQLVINGEQANAELLAGIDVTEVADGSYGMTGARKVTVKTNGNSSNIVDGKSVTVDALKADETALPTVTYSNKNVAAVTLDYNAFVKSIGTIEVDQTNHLDKFDVKDIKVNESDFQQVDDDDVTYWDIDANKTVDKTTALNSVGHYMAVVDVKANDNDANKGAKYFFTWTNVSTADYDVTVKLDGKAVEAGTIATATYDGEDIPYEVTVDGLDSSQYDVAVYKTAVDGKRGDPVTSIKDAGYYQIVVTPKGGQNLKIKGRVTNVVVYPKAVLAQLSLEGQVNRYGDSTYRVGRSYFDYTGSAVSPKFDFFESDDDGDYVDYNGEIVKLSDLTEEQRADVSNTNDRYTKVDLDSSAYSVYYTKRGEVIDASELVDRGTYYYVVRDAKPGVADNYQVETVGLVQHYDEDGKAYTENTNYLRISNERVFADVANDAWYAQVVNDAYRRDYIHGYGDGTLFGPENPITRADVATILYNVAKGGGYADVNTSYDNQSGYTTSFSDVDGKQYYSQAIQWAEKTGVVHGYGDGTFKPEQNVTREELAAMLANYAKLVRNYEAGSESDLSAFEDASSVSDWAKESVEWAVHAGVIHGKDGRVIDPQANVTRAETAAMVMNFDAIKR